MNPLPIPASKLVARGRQSASLVCSLVFGAAFLGLLINLHAQSDNFNLGNDDLWTHFDPVGDAIGSEQAVYTFPNGNSYRIQTPVIPNPALFTGRGGSLRQDVVYNDFYITVDLVDWDDNAPQSKGILARIGPNPGLGALNGYAFTHDSGGNDVDISIIIEEAPSGNIESQPDEIDLDPAKDYRFVY